MAVSPEVWLWELMPDQCAELDNAVGSFLRSGLQLEEISASNFHLPIMAPQLAEIKTELTGGRGFQLVRGLDVSKYTRLELATIFMGFGAHLGNARSQNAAGHLLGHVRNVGADAEDTNVRIYQTNERQTFHTDSCDVVGLLCLKVSKSGGESLLVSGESIYNQIREQRPDLLEYLFAPIATDKRGEVEPGTKPYFTIPVFSWHAGKLSVIYQRQYIDSAQRFADAPRLTSAHVEALDLFDQLANDERLNFSMQLQPGDMQFVHNHSMLHDRGGFVDWPEAEKRRHLLRLWLSVPGDRSLPPEFAQRFGTTKVGDRGGVIVEGTRQHVPLD
jgi:hypothetical protein